MSEPFYYRIDIGGETITTNSFVDAVKSVVGPLPITLKISDERHALTLDFAEFSDTVVCRIAVKDLGEN